MIIFFIIIGIIAIILGIYFFIGIGKVVGDIKSILTMVKDTTREVNLDPKTPYGMDSLVLPQIEKDFPNMNINEMKTLAEKNIILYLNSIESKKDLLEGKVSDKLHENLKSIFKDNEKTEIKIDNITAHKTVINRYDKDSEKCSLVFQTSIGYLYSKDGKEIQKEERINTEFIYVYASKSKYVDSISLHCENCGAPIEGLGHKICPYCKAGLVELATKTWLLNDIKNAK